MRRVLNSCFRLILIMSLVFSTSLKPTFAQVTPDVKTSVQLAYFGPMNLQVNTFNGNLFYSRRVLALPGRGLNLMADLSYNSTQAPVDGPFGFGWKFNYNIRYLNIGSDIGIQWGDGRLDLFRWNGSQFVSPSGLGERLEQYDLNRYRLTSPDGTQRLFDAPSHRGLTSIQDANGNKLQLEYRDGRLISIANDTGQAFNLNYTDGRATEISEAGLTPGRQIKFRYNEAGYLVGITNALGHETTYNYDGFRLTAVTDPMGVTTGIAYVNGVVSELSNPLMQTRFTYDAAQRQTRVEILQPEVDDFSRTIIYTYDTQGQIQSVQRETALIQYSWSDAGFLESLTDADGNQTHYTYDALGNLQEIIDPLGNTTTYRYDPTFNRVTEVKDANGETASLDYDSQGNLTGFKDPLGGKTSFGYDKEGNLVRITDANGDSGHYSYDSYGNIIGVTDALGNEITYSYDIYGNWVGVVGANGDATAITYDAVGQMTSLTNALNQTTTYEYDANGNLLNIMFPDGSRQTHTYDALGRLITVTDPLEQTTTYTYDAVGNVLEITDASGSQQTFSYNALNQQISAVDALGNTSAYQYDDMGNLISSTDENGVTSTYHYDARYLLTGIEYADGTQVTFTYDSVGALTQMTDDIGTTSYTYNAMSWLTSATDARGQTIGYSYDPIGRLVAQIYPDNSRVSYTYDPADRLLEVAYEESTTFYQYDPAGQVIKRTLPNGIVTDYEYDVVGQLTALTHSEAEGDLILSFTYKRDTLGRKAQEQRRDAKGKTVTTDYTYDAQGQLIRAESSNGNFEEYAYDEVGNRLSRITPSGQTVYEYNLAHQLHTVQQPDDSIETFSYDANGNLIKHVRPQESTRYEYNAANRLISVIKGTTETSFLYDGFGHRMAEIEDGLTREFVVDVNRVLPQVIFEMLDEDATAYLFGLSRFARVGQTTEYYLEDALQSIVSVTNDSGALVDETLYTSFGLPTDAPASQFAFNDQAFNSNTGLFYLRARYYDPELGRFVSEDPFNGLLTKPSSLHGYLYASNDPINRIDPAGLFDGRKVWNGFTRTLGGATKTLAGATLVGSGLAIGTATSVTGGGLVVGAILIAGGGIVMTNGYYDLSHGITEAINGTFDLNLRNDLPEGFFRGLYGEEGKPFDQAIDLVGGLEVGVPKSIFEAMIKGITSVDDFESAYELGNSIGIGIKGMLRQRTDHTGGQTGTSFGGEPERSAEERAIPIFVTNLQGRVVLTGQYPNIELDASDLLLKSSIVPLTPQPELEGFSVDMGHAPVITIGESYSKPGETITIIKIDDPEGDALQFKGRLVSSIGNWYGGDYMQVFDSTNGTISYPMKTICFCPVNPGPGDTECIGTFSANFEITVDDRMGNVSQPVTATIQCQPVR